MDYATIKLLHQSSVALSGLGFAVRGIASLRGAQWTQSRLAKSLPHVVDSVLLLSAVTLAAMLHLNPAHASSTFWMEDPCHCMGTGPGRTGMDCDGRCVEKSLGVYCHPAASQRLINIG